MRWRNDGEGRLVRVAGFLLVERREGRWVLVVGEGEEEIVCGGEKKKNQRGGRWLVFVF